jgi:hypothetical protein
MSLHYRPLNLNLNLSWKQPINVYNYTILYLRLLIIFSTQFFWWKSNHKQTNKNIIFLNQTKKYIFMSNLVNN